ncbi:MFS transporter [Treponema parvum]|uniref:MFS transporter n=1 Tax=Treponema parvum TaxID=138851 RepID=UPI001AEBFC48|nr:MFS transporter [Treponema parvum]QTQ16223.1 MFS transporter [Treponema parvum]
MYETMQIIIPVFFIFTVNAVVNTYLPIILAYVGYDIAKIGVLLSIFDFTGTFAALPCIYLIEKRNKYGVDLFFILLPCILLPVPIITVHNFLFSALFMGVYSIGYKCMFPVSDTVINNILIGRYNDYGKVRAIGSLSFVLMNIVMQIFLSGRDANSFEMILWMTIPAVLTAASLFFVPGLMPPLFVKKTEQKNNIKGETADGAKKVRHAISVLVVKKHPFLLSSLVSGFSASFWAAMVLLIFAFLAMSPINKFFSLYVTEFLNLNSAPAFWAVHAAVEIPAMIFSGRFIRRFGNEKILCLCVLAISFRLWTYILFKSFAGALAGQFLNYFTFGLFHPAAISFIAEHVPSKKQVTGLALYAIGANGVGNILGSFAGGIIIEKFGFPTLFLWASFLPPLAVVLFMHLKKKGSCFDGGTC